MLLFKLLFLSYSFYILTSKCSILAIKVSTTTKGAVLHMREREREIEVGIGTYMHILDFGKDEDEEDRRETSGEVSVDGMVGFGGFS